MTLKKLKQQINALYCQHERTYSRAICLMSLISGKFGTSAIMQKSCLQRGTVEEGGMTNNGNEPVPLDRLSDRFFKYLFAMKIGRAHV